MRHSLAGYATERGRRGSQRCNLCIRVQPFFVSRPDHSLVSFNMLNRSYEPHANGTTHEREEKLPVFSSENLVWSRYVFNLIQSDRLLCNIGDILTYKSKQITCPVPFSPSLQFHSRCGIRGRTGLDSRLLSIRFSKEYKKWPEPVHHI